MKRQDSTRAWKSKANEEGSVRSGSRLNPLRHVGKREESRQRWNNLFMKDLDNAHGLQAQACVADGKR
jgi:hypothetical protein